MATSIQFVDGQAYDRYMGEWSRRAGSLFLQWLAPSEGQRWLDVGCGGGAFTELVVDRCKPASVQGVDPSEEQLVFARSRPSLRGILFRQGDAMALPFPDKSFDVAVMPLVIPFVPNPVRGVSEMARVVRPGGIVSAYVWDMFDGGFPYDSLHAAMREVGVAVPVPPSTNLSRLASLRDLWTGVGLEDIESGDLLVQRTFDSFEEYWSVIQGGPSVGPGLAAMASETLGLLKNKMRQILPIDHAGRITYSARAMAIKGRVPNQPGVPG